MIALVNTVLADAAPLDDDAPPMEMLAALFDARGWRVESSNSGDFAGEIKGAWATYQLRAIWRGEDRVLQLLCLPDIRVSSDKRTAAHELLALVNEQLWLGHFDMWSDGGVLVYRHGAMLGDDNTLTLAQAQAMVETAVEECDRFYPAFQFVLWSDKPPRQALDAALIDAMGEA